MAKLVYGSTEIPISDPSAIGFLQTQLADVLAKGGGWYTLTGTSETTGEPEIVSFLLTPGVPILIQADGTPDSLGVSYDEVRTNN